MERIFMKRFRNISLKNKIYFSILAVIMMISAAIALLARGILLESLTSELEHRGVAIAQSVAEQGRKSVLDSKIPALTALLFRERLEGERRDLVSYIFIIDNEKRVVAHTFTRPFPQTLRMANPLPEGRDIKSKIRQIEVQGRKAVDIAMPMQEGIYRIATVHVGLNKQHIDTLVGRLRAMFLGFITLVVTIIFWISHKISRYITMPIQKLIDMADQISRGNLNFKLDLGRQYDDVLSEEGEYERCPAYHNSDLPCWHVDKFMGSLSPDSPPPVKPAYCRECVIRHRQTGDEVLQLADSFVYMVRSVRLYRNKVRESEAKYRTLFDSGPDPVFVVDAVTLDILDVNPRCTGTYGYSTQELFGMRFDALQSDEKQTKDLLRFASEKKPGERKFFPKIIHHRRDGQPLFVNMHACRTRYGGREAMIVSTTDITDIIEKDAQLVQASKMTTLGEMSAGIAHELNQPLNAIRMGSDYLAMMAERGKQVPEADLRQVTSEIANQIDRATEIVNTLRQFGRKSDITPERLNVNEPVHAVLKILSRQLTLQNIRVHLDLAEHLPLIRAHGNRLQQVFFNLVSNARDAINMWSDKEDGPADRVIRIHTEYDDEQVLLTISDTGAGIPGHQIEKIFEPFFTTKATGQGMGLGLAISYGIVKDYGGEISVESELGAGTTFCLSFPQAQ